ncbi:unnamed protein product [Peronospora belbahrii]|uniref:Gfo/Idh/MocA-like oxidoreductase C-terminal domain-containing protein n=1 Tax=Peronospora belbahrii TaxID=622444 RepID=A0ABN8D203_9STRA|nr:unnamed protein product [Peronospora belbahrii]
MMVEWTFTTLSRSSTPTLVSLPSSTQCWPRWMGPSLSLEVKDVSIFCLGSYSHRSSSGRWLANENKVMFPMADACSWCQFNYSSSEGFRYEAEAVVKAIQSKQQEIKEYSFGESLQIMTIMDKIRKDMGLVYPADNK